MKSKRPRKFKITIRQLVVIVLCILMVLPALMLPVMGLEDNQTVTIVLDPGHGGSVEQNKIKNQAVGAEKYGVEEKNANLKIALFLRDELNKYQNVNVYLTREDDSNSLTLNERASIAKHYNPNILISLHNNACERHDSNGSEVYVPNGIKYRNSMTQLGNLILNELSTLGLKNNGVMTRTGHKDVTSTDPTVQSTQETAYYSDGTVSDYYGIIRHSYNYGFPAIIVEHAYVDNYSDAVNHLSNDDQLKALAQADAKAIAEYYGLAIQPLEPIIQKDENEEKTEKKHKKKVQIIDFMKKILKNSLED